MTQPSTDADARIIELESRVALQDDSLNELSDEIYRQQQQIARLETSVRRLAERLQSIELAEPAEKPPDEVPPHY